MHAFTIFVACTCLIVIAVGASNPNKRRRFNIPYKAEEKKQIPDYYNGGDPSDPNYYLGDDILSQIIIELGNHFGAELCVDQSFNFPLGYRCDGYCMPAEFVCDNYTDCYSYFDDEDAAACKAREDAEAIFNYCSVHHDGCHDDGDYAYDCVTYYDMDYTQTSPIYWYQVCDGFMDCVDGSDEYNCGINNDCPCDPYNMDSVPCDFFCDGWPDCPGGEDEDGCGYTCTFGCYMNEYDEMGYQYETWGEIPCEWECDGYPDCVYGEDEMEYMCGPSFYTCPVYDDYSGEMYCEDVESYMICDGYQNCYDGSDEEYCGDPGTPYPYMTTGYYYKKDSVPSKESFKKSGKFRRYDDVNYRVEQQAKRTSKKDTTGVLFKKKENLPKERHYMKSPKQVAKIREMRKTDKAGK